MKLLLDTHAPIWALLGDSKLSEKARLAITDPDNDVFVSSASAWEIAVKRRLGKLPEATELADGLAKHMRQAQLTPLAITLEHALAAGALAGPHKDPFDRMLIAQAQLERLRLVSIDSVFQAYGVAIYW